MEAARHWARGNRSEFLVAPDNLPAVACFTAMSTQWRVRADETLIGLRYEALPAVMDLLEIQSDSRPKIFASLRLMELEALSVSSGAV